MKEKYEKEKKTKEKTTKEADKSKSMVKGLEKDIRSQADNHKAVASEKDVKIREVQTHRSSEQKTATTNIGEAKTETVNTKAEVKQEKARLEAEIKKA